MPILVFTTLHDKILDGSKRQTVRKNHDYWQHHWIHDNPLHIWLGSPRSGKGKKYGVAKWTWFESHYGNYLYHTNYIAKLDGFQTGEELVSVLAELHEMTIAGVCAHKWAVIRFEMVELCDSLVKAVVTEKG